MNGGYVKIHRALRDSPIYQLTPGQRCVFFEVLLSANWKPGKWLRNGEAVDVRRGESCVSLKNLANRSGVSIGTTRRALAALVSNGTIEVYPARKYTRIYLVNYEQYQSRGDEAGTNTDTIVDTQTGLQTGDNRRKQEKKKKEEAPKTSKPLPPESLELADKLRDHILTRQPDHREVGPSQWSGTQRRWADSFRLAHERDGREWGEMGRVLDWSQRDVFWQANILSGAKFRKQFDRLKGQMGQSSHRPRVALGDILGGGNV